MKQKKFIFSFHFVIILVEGDRRLNPPFQQRRHILRRMDFCSAAGQDGRQNEGGAFPDNGDAGAEAAKCQREISRICAPRGISLGMQLPHKLA